MASLSAGCYTKTTKATTPEFWRAELMADEDDPGATPQPGTNTGFFATWGSALLIIMVVAGLAYGAYQMERSHNTRVVPNKFMDKDPDIAGKSPDNDPEDHPIPGSGVNPYMPSSGGAENPAPTTGTSQ
jgi:hypothetical protein